MKLALDVMGFENNIKEAINASRSFCKKNKDVEIILVGDQNLIKKELKHENEFEIIHANDIIEQKDNILVLRTKKDSSMAKAIQLVQDKKADGVLSAGNSTLYVFLTYQIFSIIENVEKIGFMPYVPTFVGQGFNLLDVGASLECNGEDLYKLSIMGNVAAKLRNISTPRIGLLNIGTEAHKGFNRHQVADKLLKENKDINYIGFIEAKNLLEGVCDVVVTDGYVGNIFLKSIEGTSKSIFSNLLKRYKKPYNLLGLLFSLPVLLSIKNKFDYKNNAGAFVLGVNNIAVKTHGSADFKQFYSSLRMLKESIEFDLLNKIKKDIKKYANK